MRTLRLQSSQHSSKHCLERFQFTWDLKLTLPRYGFPGNTLNAVDGGIVFYFYDGPTPPSNVFAEFNAIGALVDQTKTQSYYSVSQSVNGGKQPGFGNSFRANTVPNMPADQMVQFLDVYSNETFSKTFLDGIQNLDVQLVSVDTQPLSVNILQASQVQGGNALGFDPANGDRIWIENSYSWLGELCNTKCPQFSKESSDKLLAYQKTHYAGVTPTNYKSGDIEFTKSVSFYDCEGMNLLTSDSYNPLFMNDAAPYQDVYSSYGQKNLARLQSIKKQYDPTGFFTHRQGGFKLPS